MLPFVISSSNIMSTELGSSVIIEVNISTILLQLAKRKWFSRESCCWLSRKGCAQAIDWSKSESLIHGIPGRAAIAQLLVKDNNHCFVVMLPDGVVVEKVCYKPGAIYKIWPAMPKQEFE